MAGSGNGTVAPLSAQGVHHDPKDDAARLEDDGRYVERATSLIDLSRTVVRHLGQLLRGA